MNFEIAPKSTEIHATWDEARLYCFSLEIDGKVGWRLPTKDELNEIYNSDNDFVCSYYWSSSEYFGTCAWAQFYAQAQVFSNGFQYAGNKNDTYYVRAVRPIN